MVARLSCPSRKISEEMGDILLVAAEAIIKCLKAVTPKKPPFTFAYQHVPATDTKFNLKKPRLGLQRARYPFGFDRSSSRSGPKGNPAPIHDCLIYAQNV